jgi:hypothetical protein
MLLKTSALILLTIFSIQESRDAKSQSPNSVKKNSATNQAPSAQSPPLSIQAALDNNQQQSGNVAAKNESVQVISLPKVSIESRKDLYDKVLVIATSLLVLVGGFQIFYLWRTVAVAQAAANAAKISAEAVINSERAWLLLGDFTEEQQNYRPEGINLYLTFKNYGKTPAWVVEHSFHFVRVPKRTSTFDPLEPYDPQIIPFGEPVPPDKPYPRICAQLELDEAIIGRPDMPSDFIFYGHIKYQDVFYPTTRKTRVTLVRKRFERTPDDVVQERPGRWVNDGPPEANWCQ